MVSVAQLTWYALALPLPTEALLFPLTLADNNRHADVHSDFANLDDLWHYDRILRDLDEKQDDDSDVAVEREPVHAPQHDSSRPTRSSNRPSRQTTTKRHSYKEASEGEDEDDSRQSSSRRAKEYADARKGLIDRVHQVIRSAA